MKPSINQPLFVVVAFCVLLLLTCDGFRCVPERGVGLNTPRWDEAGKGKR